MESNRLQCFPHLHFDGSQRPKPRPRVSLISREKKAIYRALELKYRLRELRNSIYTLSIQPCIKQDIWAKGPTWGQQLGSGSARPKEFEFFFTYLVIVFICSCLTLTLTFLLN